MLTFTSRQTVRDGYLRVAKTRRIRLDQKVAILGQGVWLWGARTFVFDMEQFEALAHRHWHSAARGDWKRSLSGHADISDVNLFHTLFQSLSRGIDFAHSVSCQHCQEVNRSKVKKLNLILTKDDNTDPQ